MTSHGLHGLLAVSILRPRRIIIGIRMCGFPDSHLSRELIRIFDNIRLLLDRLIKFVS